VNVVVARRRPNDALAFVAVVLALVVALPALAINVPGTNGNDLIRGTAKADRLFGRGGNDRLLGLAGNDLLNGGPGRDYADGGLGNDRLLLRDTDRDTAVCGAGRDTVVADRRDSVRATCEIVLRPAPPAPPAPPPPPPPPLGSRDNPIPLGQSAPVGNGWTVTVTGVVPDATAQILAANQFNDPPAAGNQFFMISASGTYNGSGSSRLDSGFSMRAVGASQVAYTTFDNSCGVLPEPNLELDDPQVFAGGTVSGNAACWQIRSSDASSLVMFYRPFLEDQMTWFALR
jgi:hypothetical protein